jgi:replicative DNA helicase
MGYYEMGVDDTDVRDSGELEEAADTVLMLYRYFVEDEPAPRRIQRKRTKGWKMPPGAVYVGRPTKWGNPWLVTATMSANEAVELYKMDLKREPAEFFEPLRNKDLACWCPLDKPCHADVLLELANK